MKNLFKYFFDVLGVRLFFKRTIPLGFDTFQDIQNHFEHIHIDLIIDAGANIGQSVHYFKKAIPKANVICFEPVKNTFDQLKLNTKTLAGIRLEQKALGDSLGESNIVIKSNSLWNTLKTVTNDGNFETVQVTTLDHFLNQNELGHISLLKIDVEGFELNVIKGAEESLKKGLIDFVLIEVGINENDLSHTYFELIKNELGKHGFRFISHYAPSLVGSSGHYANALFYDSRRLNYTTK